MAGLANTTHLEKMPGRGVAAIIQPATDETAFFLVTLLFGLHSAVSIMPFGKMLVPYAIALFSALGILSIQPHRISNRVVHWFVILLCFIIVLALFIGTRDGKYFVHLRSSAQFVYSILIGYGAFVGLTSIGTKRTEKIFFWVSVFLIMGATLELLGPLKPLSDWFRGVFNAWYGLYDADSRDILRYGAVRPKFFASEPSLLALSMGFSLFLWLSAKRRCGPNDLLTALLLTGWGFYLVRSPNILFGPLAIMLIKLLLSRDTRVIRSLKSLTFGIYVVIAALLPAVSIFATITLPNAPTYIKDLSYFERIDAPFLIAADAIRSFPFFGIGMGDQEQMSQLTIKTFHDMNLLAFQTIAQVSGLGHLIGNVFWEYWIIFGLAGGLIISVFFSRLVKFLQIPLSGITILIIAGTTFWQGFGGVNSPLTWFSVFIVAAGCCFQNPEIPAASAPSSRRESLGGGKKQRYSA